MKNLNLNNPEDLSQTLNNISKEALIHAIEIIGGNYAGFLSASFDIGYYRDYEWVKLYAHFHGNKVYMASKDTDPGVAVIETISSALVMLNERIKRGFSIPELDLTGTEQSPLECTKIFNHSGQNITDAFLDHRTEYAA